MVIIHQMAKVGSTAIHNALVRAGIVSLQTHNLGLHHLQNNLTSFFTPLYSLERVTNELPLFRDQILASKHLELARQPGQPRQKIITLSRDPVVRWFSAMVQNYAFLKDNVAEFFTVQSGRAPSDDLESFDFIFDFMLGLVNDSGHRLGSHEFNESFWHSPHVDSTRANDILLQVGAELMVPFTWFQSNIRDLTGIDLYAQTIEDGYLVTGNEHFELLYIKFENLRRQRIETERILGEFVGKKVELASANVSRGKAGFDAMQQLEDKYVPLFMSSPAISESEYCRHFGYPDTR